MKRKVNKEEEKEGSKIITVPILGRMRITAFLVSVYELNKNISVPMILQLPSAAALLTGDIVLIWEYLTGLIIAFS